MQRVLTRQQLYDMIWERAVSKVEPVWDDPRHQCREPDAVQQVMAITDGAGVDAAIEAVGVPASFIMCEDIVAPAGVIANVGVHGAKADLHLERLWSQNISITTRLVDTVSTPMLLEFSLRPPDRSESADYASLQIGSDHGCLRHLQSGSRDACGEVDNRDLISRKRCIGVNS